MPRRRAGVAGEIDGAHGDRHQTAVGHRVARVDDEVHDDLLQLSRIGLDRRARRVQLEDQLDPFSEQRAEHGRQVLHDLAHVQDTWLHDLLVAEGQQLPCQGCGEGRGCLDLIDVVAQVGLVGPDLAAREVAVAGDGLQDVVEVVRDTAGKTPDGFHLLCLAQLVLALLERLVCLLTLGQRLLERTGLPRHVAEEPSCIDRETEPCPERKDRAQECNTECLAGCRRGVSGRCALPLQVGVVEIP